MHLSAVQSSAVKVPTGDTRIKKPKQETSTAAKQADSSSFENWRAKKYGAPAADQGKTPKENKVPGAHKGGTASAKETVPKAPHAFGNLPSTSTKTQIGDSKRQISNTSGATNKSQDWRRPPGYGEGFLTI